MLRILLIEDDPRNIQAAKDQFPNAEITVMTTCVEVNNAIGKSARDLPYDVVLTDYFIPMGNAGDWDVAKYHSPTELVPIGALVALRAIKAGIPCLIMSNTNGHKNISGLMLENLTGQYVQNGLVDGQFFALVRTREEAPKDWLSGLMELMPADKKHLVTAASRRS